MRRFRRRPLAQPSALRMSCDRARSLDLAAFVADPASPEFAAFREHYPVCAACTREVARWTELGGILRAASDGTDPHPDADALLALERAPGRLAPGAREALEAHVSACSACQTELRALRTFDFAALRRARDPRAAAPPGRPPSRGAPGPLRGRRAILLAAAVAAALLVWALPTLLRPTRPPDPVSPEPREVARAGPRSQPDTAPAVPPAPEPEAAPSPSLREPALAVAPEPRPTEPKPPAPEREPVRVALVFATEPLRYSAPGAPDPVLSRLREPEVVRAAGAPAVRIRALAPDHTGLTASASPTLYWTLSEDTALRVELVVTDPGAETPLLDLALDGAGAGLHALSLSEHRVALEPGRTYRWYASLVPDPEDRSGEIVSGGEIRRVPSSADLERRLAEEPAGMRAHLLAEAGFFYDALATLSTWAAEHPGAAEPQRHRATLLASVGLADALPEASPGSRSP